MKKPERRRSRQRRHEKPATETVTQLEFSSETAAFEQNPDSLQGEVASGQSVARPRRNRNHQFMHQTRDQKASHNSGSRADAALQRTENKSVRELMKRGVPSA